MRICHIVPSLEARHGGPSKSVPGLAAALAAGGDQVELLTTDPLKAWEMNQPNLSVRAFKRDFPGMLRSSGGLRRHLKQVEADVVHHHALWLRTVDYARRAALQADASFVLSPRGMMDPWAWGHHKRRKRLARALVHPGAFEAADGWHATSAQEADYIRGLGFKQPVCVAPNGISAPPLEDLQQARSAWHALIPQAREMPVALFYSRFHRKKRVIELIDLWLESAPRDWLLVMAGIPEEYDPRDLEAYVLRQGGKGRIRAMSGAGLPEPYAIANLFVLPSHGENFGLSIAEAMASGVPCLVTDSTPWSELNRAGAGWCVPWEGFGSALRAATSEKPEFLRQRGQIAKEWVLRDFSWDKSARLLAAFYGQLRSAKGRSAP